MAILDIKLMGEDVLREVAEPIPEDEIESQSTQELIDDMIETASQNPEHGFITAGLAAPQVGVSKRIFLIIAEGSTKKSPKFNVYINPELDFTTDELKDSNESCLSTPHLCGTVKRYTRVKITYYDREGNKQRETFAGDFAIYLQHENDHLDGVLWIDKVEDTKTISFC